MTSTTSPFFPSFLTSHTHTHTHTHTHSHTHVAFLLFFLVGFFFFSEIFVASARRCGFLFLFFDPASKIFFSNFLSLFCLEPLCFVASLQGAVDLVSSFHHIFIHFFSPFFLFFFCLVEDPFDPAPSSFIRFYFFSSLFLVFSISIYLFIFIILFSLFLFLFFYFFFFFFFFFFFYFILFHFILPFFRHSSDTLEFIRVNKNKDRTLLYFKFFHSLLLEK